MVDNVANTKHHWLKYTTEVYLKLNGACLPDTINIISNLSLSIGSFFKFLLCICLDMIIDFYRQRPLQQLEMEKKRKQPDLVWRHLKKRIYQNGTHRLVKIQTTISLDRLKLIRYSQTLYHHAGFLQCGLPVRIMCHESCFSQSLYCLYLRMKMSICSPSKETFCPSIEPSVLYLLHSTFDNHPIMATKQ